MRIDITDGLSLFAICRNKVSYLKEPSTSGLRANIDFSILTRFHEFPKQNKNKNNLL